MKSAHSPAQPTTRSLAAQWIALKRSGQMTVEDARALEDWLRRDAAHKDQYEKLEAVWDAAGELREEPAILTEREWALSHYDRPSRERLVGVIAAGVSVIAFGAWVAIGSGALSGFDFFARPQLQEMRTGVGQTATVKLPDGSVVTLDTDTVLRAGTFGRKRLVELERGKAFFSVAKDPGHPFIVTAADRTVTATGTSFAVRFDPKLFQVTLVEGKVKVEAPRGQTWRGQSTDMRAGWQLAERDGRRWTLEPVDVNKETSWLNGRLTFYNDQLGDAAAEMNRYSEKKIIVDREIAGAPIVGIFKIGDVDGFVRASQLTKLTRIVREDDKTIVIAAARGKS